jgi:hypothetical protein
MPGFLALQGARIFSADGAARQKEREKTNRENGRMRLTQVERIERYHRG